MRPRPRSNRYWRRLSWQGGLCECCGAIMNANGTMEHRATGVRICVSRCYGHRKQALETALAARAWKAKMVVE